MVLSHNADRAGRIQWSTPYVRARRSCSHAVGGLTDLKASLRSEEKPHRDDRWRTDLHCSYERLCSSKFLAGGCKKPGRQGKGFANLLGIYDREEGLKILAVDLAQGYDEAQSFVIADAELSKLGGEIDRVAREKVSVNAVQRTIDLQHCQRGECTQYSIYEPRM